MVPEISSSAALLPSATKGTTPTLSSPIRLLRRHSPPPNDTQRRIPAGVFCFQVDARIAQEFFCATEENDFGIEIADDGNSIYHG
jgi:hypothetical protein